MVVLSSILKREEIKRAHFEGEQAPISEEIMPLKAALPAESIYEDLVRFTGLILSKTAQDGPFDLLEVKEKIQALVKYMNSADPEGLLRLIDRYNKRKDYLIVHSVNVCILSLGIARGLHYENEKLLDIGMGALLHDIGMVLVKGILDKERSLYKAEYEEVKNHANYGTNILQGIKGVNNDILVIVRQHHERMDGSGYPEGSMPQNIHEYARIVGLADVYEALVHSRPHRDKLEPFEYATIKEIISNRQLFDPYILRVFIERMTRHPAYMLWLLAAGISQVLEENKGLSSKGAPVSLKQDTAGKKRKIIFFFAMAVILAGIAISLIINLPWPAKREVLYPTGESLYIGQDKAPFKLAYDFTAGTLNTYASSIDLSGIDLSKYYFLSLMARIDDRDALSRAKEARIRIEIENTRKEKAEYYLQGIQGAWREFVIPLSYFTALNDWSRVSRVYFALQPWNMESRKGAVYIENIRFLRKR